MNGAMVAFVPHTTSGATVTLNIDSLGGKPLRFGPSLELQSGVLIQGTPYVVSYNNSDGAFYLQGGFANPYGIPLGGIIPYAGTTAPNSAFALLYGQAISQSTYATLYALVGPNAFAPDSGGNFFLPDLRGRAIFGQDNMGGSAAGRIAATFNGAIKGAAGGAETQTLTQAQLPAHTHSGTTGTESATHTHGISGSFVTGQPGSGAIGGSGSLVVPQTNTESATHTHSFTTDNGTGGGQAHPIMPPAIVLPYILRII
jgi:microcystin-dependent protein